MPLAVIVIKASSCPDIFELASALDSGADAIDLSCGELGWPASNIGFALSHQDILGCWLVLMR
jgi:hypothetical protein